MTEATREDVSCVSAQPHHYTITDSPKMLRETLCMAQAALGHAFPSDGRLREHLDRLGRLINECDRHRPLGPNGKHDERHTATCGCDTD